MFDFSLCFNAFLTDFGPPDGTPKSSQNLSRIRLGRPKAPQGRQRPPRSLQGAILRPPGSHFGAILEPCLDHFGDMLGHFPTQATCKPCRSCYHSSPGFQGRRVPALALTITSHSPSGPATVTTRRGGQRQAQRKSKSQTPTTSINDILLHPARLSAVGGPRGGSKRPAQGGPEKCEKNTA